MSTVSRVSPLPVRRQRPVWVMLAGVLLASCPGAGLIAARAPAPWVHGAGVVLVVTGLALVTHGARRFLAVAAAPLPGRHRSPRRRSH